MWPVQKEPPIPQKPFQPYWSIEAMIAWYFFVAVVYRPLRTRCGGFSRFGRYDTARPFDFALQFPLTCADPVIQDCDDLVSQFYELFDGSASRFMVSSFGEKTLTRTRTQRARRGTQRPALSRNLLLFISPSCLKRARTPRGSEKDKTPCVISTPCCAYAISMPR